MNDLDLGDVNLLEWSHELDRCLLQLPFRPLRSTTDDRQAVFLYKLAYSTSRKELGLLLLDCDACSAYYEGLSLRTLDRRTQLQSPEQAHSVGSDDTAQLRAISSAIQHALDPLTAQDPAFKVTIGLDSSRFSCALSISVKSKASDEPDRDIKTSFDLDTLDHASLSKMLSSHFIRPLLGLATTLARSASLQQIEVVQNIGADSYDGLVNSDSLELLRRCALTQCKLPISQLRPLSISIQDNLASITDKASYHAPTKHRSTQAEVHGNSPAQPLHADQAVDNHGSSDSDLDSVTEMVFFGPPGLQRPDRRRTSAATAKRQARSSSPEVKPGSDQADGDITLIAPIAKTDGETTVQGSLPSDMRRTASDGQSGSETSEEESLPVLGSKQSDAGSNRLSSPSPARPARDRTTQFTGTVSPETQHERKSNRVLSKTEPRENLTDPTTQSTLPSTPSQSTQATRDEERSEQNRRRQEIARIKSGTSNQAQSNANAAKSSQAIPPSSTSSRKRSRF